jgi:ribulose 1,5-bisphosphate synthetase/thiazole synthase
MTETISRNDQVPVKRDVDVLVVGCGIFRLFAALSATREDARVFVVDRLYTPGGNISPDMLVGAFVGQDRNSGWVTGLDKDRTYGGLV